VACYWHGPPASWCGPVTLFGYSADSFKGYGKIDALKVAPLPHTFVSIFFNVFLFAVNRQMPKSSGGAQSC